MSFAIYRTEKLKSFGEIGGSLSHTYRTRNTPNADENRIHLNEHSLQTYNQCFEAIKKSIPEKRRSNAVLCIEHLITASPAWEGWGTEKEKEFFDKSLDFVKKKYGSENVIAHSIHRDETTPHLIVYVTPIDEKGGLNAKKWLGGRAILSQTQTQFAKEVKHLGLNRGVENSKARHKTVKEFYAEIQKPVSKKEIKPINIKKFSGDLPKKRGLERSESYAQKVVDVVFDDAQKQVEQAVKFYMDEIAATHDHYQRVLRLEQIKTESEKVARRRAEDAATKLSKEVVSLRKDFDQKVRDIRREEDRLEKLYGTYFEFKYLYPDDARQLEEKMKVKIYNHPKKVIEREAMKDYEQYLQEREQQFEQKRQERERQKQLELERERQKQLELERERQKQLELERERQKQLELERERQKQLELERERQKQLELEQQLRLEMESQPEKVVQAKRVEEDYDGPGW